MDSRAPLKCLSLNNSTPLSESGSCQRFTASTFHLSKENKFEEEDVLPPSSCKDKSMDIDWHQTPPNGSSVKLVAPTPLSKPFKHVWTFNEITLHLGQFSLKSEYRKHLFSKEQTSFITNAFHVQCRRRIVDWIFEISQQVKLHRTTIYRAISYFDTICSCHAISRNKLQHVGAVCLVLAAKWNEMEHLIPSYRQMAYFCGDDDPCLHEKLRTLEPMLLALLNWSLAVILPIDFVSFFLDDQVIFHDDMIDGSPVKDHPEAKKYIEKFALFFIDVVSQNYEYLKFLPSMIGASMIVCARRALRIVPYWNPNLASVVGYSMKEIGLVVQEVWDEYKTRFPEDAKRAENGLDC